MSSPDISLGFGQNLICEVYLRPRAFSEVHLPPDYGLLYELHAYGRREDIVDHLIGLSQRRPRHDWWRDVCQFQAHVDLEVLCAWGNAHARAILRRAPNESVLFVARALSKRAGHLMEDGRSVRAVAGGLEMVSEEMRRRGYSRALRVALLRPPPLR